MTYVWGSLYFLTPQQFQPPQTPAFVGIHLTLLLAPLLFALRCLSDHEKFGRAYGYLNEAVALAVPIKEKTGKAD